MLKLLKWIYERGQLDGQDSVDAWMAQLEIMVNQRVAHLTGEVGNVTDDKFEKNSVGVGLSRHRQLAADIANIRNDISKLRAGENIDYGGWLL